MRPGVETVASETVSASITIKAPAETIFAVLIDPAKHAAIDGTGWVCDPIDRQTLAATGQIFRMAMYHPGHPNGNYEIANRVEIFDAPHAISWKPGTTQATAPSASVAGSGATTWPRSARPRPRSGLLTTGRLYLRRCCADRTTGHPSPAITWTTR